MQYGEIDERRPLNGGDVVSAESGEQYVVDRLIGSGGFSLCYLTHLKGTDRYTVLKELYPKRTEGGVTARRSDGRIVIVDPLVGTEEHDNAAAWEREERIFRREAALSRKAARLYDAEGRPVAQNNPDVSAVTGPFRDARGNRYVAVDTAQGEPLKRLIERGFVRDGKGGVTANSALEEILTVLEKTARLLSRLHRENRLLHLDVSPDNIYLTMTSAGTEPQPKILDYGSAYDLDDPAGERSHHYSCNPFSPPEIQALADLNDPDAGYRADASSDTYGVVNILFYAVTGRVYDPDMAGDEGWREALREEYTRERYGEKDGKAFSELLIGVLDKGLADGQEERYRTAEELDRALRALIKVNRGDRGILNGMDPDELMSWLLLEKYPLYSYKNGKGELELLFVGGGEFAQRMILSAVSCGQMPDAPLRIRVVSREREEDFRRSLLARAPLLADYTDLAGSAGVEEWASFTYTCVPDILEPEAGRRVLAEYPDCRWILVSLGGNRENADTARLLAAELTARGAEAPAVIHYHASEDVGRNQRKDVPGEVISRMVQVVPFGTGFSSFRQELRTLEKRTVRQNFLYERLYDPRATLESSAASLTAPGGLYGLRSSCAAALHAKYKLAALGIDPGKDLPGETAASYVKLLKGPERGKLLQLEHRRWMMYMAADGFRLPSLEELERCGFSYVGERFVNAFHDRVRKLHPCLVPCSAEGIRLPGSRKFWDGFGSFAAIDETDLDPLDKMSLKLHFIARKRLRAPQYRKQMKDDFENRVLRPLLEREEAQQAMRLQQAAAGGEPLPAGGDPLLKEARERAEELRVSLDTLPEFGAWDAPAALKKLKEAYKTAGIDAERGFLELERELAIGEEFAKYRDYKAPDDAIIDHLLWLLSEKEEAAVLIKLHSGDLLDNVLSPLMLMPKMLVYVGGEPNHALERFFSDRGVCTGVSFEPVGGDSVRDAYETLRALRFRMPGKCVIDITGGDECSVCAAMLLQQEDRGVALIRSNGKTQRLERVSGETWAETCSLTAHITAEEVFGLYGAKRNPASDHRYMLRLGRTAAELWEFYQEFRDDWAMITAFFSNRGRGDAELRIFGARGDAEVQEWRRFIRPVSRHTWAALKLDESFRQMENEGFIRDLRTEERGLDGLQISFSFPAAAEMSADDRNLKNLNSFFNRRLLLAQEPFRCVRRESAGTPVFALESGSFVSVYDWRDPDFADKRQTYQGSYRRYPYADVFPALHRLEELGFLRDLKTELLTEPVPAVRIEFSYADRAVFDCLKREGNVLEFYAWYSAMQSGEFDDCRANLDFRWEEGIRNELDLILTKGLATLVVSCKTAKFDNSHLYEIRWLTDRFSLNSKAVIIYSSSLAVDEDGHLTDDLWYVKQRAKAMGIALIDMNEVPAGQLGQLLASLAAPEESAPLGKDAE